MKDRPFRPRPAARRESLPRRKTPAPRKSRPPKGRWKRVSAFVARKVEEHARLAQDAMKIALTLALLVLALMLANAFYRVAQEDSRPPSSAARTLPPR